MVKFFNRVLFPFLCIIFIFNSFFFSIDLFSFTSYASAAMGNDLFWDVLSKTYDFKQQEIYLEDFIVLPSDEFNEAVKELADENFPFCATPHRQNQFGVISITPSDIPKAYVVFSYGSSKPKIIRTNPVLILGGDWYSAVTFVTSGFSSDSRHTALPSDYFWAFAKTDSSHCAPTYFRTSNDASFNNNRVNILPYSTCLFDDDYFGVYECPCDDNTVFTPPSPAPSGSDVYIPKGALNVSELSYKVGDDFYNIDGDPIDDPTNSGGGNSSGDITVGGKIEVDGKVDINVNVNGGVSLPDTDLEENLPEAPQGFIDYLKKLFVFLPPSVLAIIVAGICAAIFCRIWGR